MFRQSETQVAQKSPRKPRWGRRGLALLVVVCVLFSLFCFPVGALSSQKLSFSAPSYGLIIAKDSSGNTTGIQTEFGYFVSGGKQQYYVKPKDGSNISSLVRFVIKIPFTVSVPSGNFWRLKTNCYVSARKSSGDYINCSLTGLKVNLQEDGLSEIFSWQGSSKSVQVSTAPRSSNSGELNFSFSVFSDITNFDYLFLIFDDVYLEYGLEGEFSSQISQDNEEQKANEGGKDSSDKAQNAIPSVNEGFANSLKTFVGSMSYDGTQALLPIPKTSIPAMSGVTDEITLISAQDYDLSAAINQYIPETLLQLIRHLFTIALVLYCVYELYGLIQYVLTLKKGGKDE